MEIRRLVVAAFLSAFTISNATIVISASQSASPEASPTVTYPVECDEIAAWDAEGESYLEQTTFRQLDEDDFLKLRPSELLDIAAEFYWMAESLESMEYIPGVILTYHELLVDQFSLYGNMLSSMATGGIFAAFAYTEPIDQVAVDMQAAWDTGYTVCGQLWSEALPGGINGGLLPSTPES